MSPPSSSQTSTLLLPFSRPPAATTSLPARFPPSHSSSFTVPSSSRLPTTHEASLSVISDDVIVTCLRERFMSDTIYTNIGSSALVAVNPHKYVASNADSLLQKYAAYYRDTTENKTPLPPHIFQLANNAYYHMRRTIQDQSLIMSGEAGSGKSETRRLAIKTLLELSVSNPGKKGSKLATQVPAAEFVIESFGNTRTLFNPNASRFGKYTELQFTDKRNRVAAVPSGERNFHIFYYLMAGASAEERHHLHLADKTQYRYLGHRAGASTRANGVRDDDANRFEQLKMALKSVGLSKRHVAQTCQLVAAILHLGNIEFTIDRGRDMDTAVVRGVDVLGIVTEFLGIQPSALETTLAYKTKLVKRELCTIFLDTDRASNNRDDLAKTLYSLLFAWLNEHINRRLCRDDFDTFIGLFDLPGPQNMTSCPNSLDQFCINFANEHLQNFVRKCIFESHVDEYRTEGISRFVPSVPYFDNAECVRLLQNKPGGLIHIMDDQARRSHKKTDLTMVEAFGKRWGNHSSFKVGPVDRSGSPAFTVNHFNGPVSYSSEGFLERNLDSLNPDFVSLLRGSLAGAWAGQSIGIPAFTVNHFNGPVSYSSEGFLDSLNPDFVSLLRGSLAGVVPSPPKHIPRTRTIVSAQQPVKPMRTPSTRRKGTVKRMATLREDSAVEEQEREDNDAPNSSSGLTPCVAGEFRAALGTLFETLSETQSWFVFCANPNDSQLPNQLEGRSIKGQIRSLGLTEVSKRNVNVFEVGLTLDEFCTQYGEPMAKMGVMDGSAKEKVEQTGNVLGLQETDIVLGQYKVFLSQAAFHSLEDRLRDPYAPYASPGLPPDDYADPYNQVSSQAHVPLVANPSPFQRGNLYKDDYEDQTNSNYGSESYAPSRNMFQNADKEGLIAKEALAGEIMENETTGVVKETSARRRWVLLCWLLTWWIPSIFLKWFGRMKREDVRQAWREKFALNVIIWFICACAVFVIAVLGVVICPTEHVFSTSELASHSFSNSANNVYTAIRGEVFDLTQVAASSGDPAVLKPVWLAMRSPATTGKCFLWYRFAGQGPSATPTIPQDPLPDVSPLGSLCFGTAEPNGSSLLLSSGMDTQPSGSMECDETAAVPIGLVSLQTYGQDSDDDTMGVDGADMDI
ncbi:P-loop containing nucleoside triphosphate hydrolase protein [Boletus edulis]|nr:P-loop containing nucleoside triphosphate hydrolase protein [Boletus edulis]